MQYRRLPLADLPRFEGVGVYYGATFIEAQLCEGEEVIVVGGGNSAGQAAVFLAGRARHVHMLVRGDGLAETMSRYLIQRIEESPQITLRTRTEIVALEGDGWLERVAWRGPDGATEARPIRHVFLMTGAEPNTEWLRGCVALDDKGFVKTGTDLDPRGPRRPLGPAAHALLARDQPARHLRGGRRALGQRQARRRGRRRGLGLHPARPPRARRVRRRALLRALAE